MATLFRPVPVPVQSLFPALKLSVVPAAKVVGGNTKISTTAPDSGCSLSLCFPAGMTASSARKFKYICCAGPEFGDNYKKPIVIEFGDDPVYDFTIAKISFVVGVFIDAALVERAVNEALEAVEFVADGFKSDIISLSQGSE